MKFIAALIAFVCAVAINAQYVNVYNNCTYAAYLQSAPYNPSEPAGPILKLKPNGVGTYTEKFNPGGSTIKLDRGPSLPQPLFAGYSLGTNPFLVYYEFSSRFGNPFLASPNSFAPGRPQSGTSCQRFKCAANNAGCYSTGNPAGGMKVYNCVRPTNLTVTLCGLGAS